MPRPCTPENCGPNRIHPPTPQLKANSRNRPAVPYIRVIHEDEAEGELFKVYDEIQKTRGRVSNVLRIQSLDPKGLQKHLDLYMAHVYGKGPLSRHDREMIAVVVSTANGCDYCIAHHSDALQKYAKDETWVNQVATDYTQADMPAERRALCDYAHHLTVDPGNNRKAAVETLRAAGFEDEAILQATEIAAYFNYVNRIVHGLGVELEANEDPADYNY